MRAVNLIAPERYFPTPKNWSIIAPVVQIETATLDEARYLVRTTGSSEALKRWEALAYRLAEAAETIEEASYAFFEAPESGAAYLMSFAKWDRCSVALVEAASTPKELCRLKQGLGVRLAAGGQAEHLLMSKLTEQYHRLKRYC